MTVPGADAAKMQIDRLRALGYSIIDVEATAPGAFAALPDRQQRRGANP